MAQKRFYGVKNHPKEEKNGIYDSWESCSEVVRGAKGVLYKGFGTREEAESFCGLSAEKEIQAEAPAAQPAVAQIEKQAPSSGGLVFDARRAMTALDYLKDCNVMDDSTYASVKLNIGQKSMEAVKEKEAVIDPTRMSIEPITMFVDGSYNNRTDKVGYGVYMQGVGKDTRDKGKEAVLYGSAPMASGGNNVEGEVTAAWVGLQYLSDKGMLNRPVTVYCDYEGVRNWADKEWRRNKEYTKAYAEKVDAFRRNGADIRFIHVDGHTGVDGNEIVDRLAKMGCGVHFDGEAQFRKDIDGVPGAKSGVALDMPVYQNESALSAQQYVIDDDYEF